MLVHLCLSVLLTIISLIVFICNVSYELINDDDDDDEVLSGCRLRFPAGITQCSS